MISSHNSYSGSPSASKAGGKSSSVFSNPSFRSACVSLLIKPSKNAENADTISQSVRVSVLLYPHIIRTELTMASYWRNERSDSGWHLAESSREEQQRVHFSETHEVPDNRLQLLRWKYKWVSEEEFEIYRQSRARTKKNRCVVGSLCCSPVFSAEQELYNPRRGIRFHSSAHVSIINAKTSRNPYWSSQAYWCAAMVPPHCGTDHTASAPSLWQKQMPK